MNLKDAIVTTNVLDKETCNLLIDQSKNWDWVRGTWFDYARSTENGSPTTEVTEANYTSTGGDQQFQLLMRDCVVKALKVYNDKVSLFNNSVDIVNIMRMNRYEVGNDIKFHKDHIHSLFDGELKGIPVLSFVGVFNDDYEGGDFIFFKDEDEYKIKLSSGDVVMFPSCFLYPHQVTPVTKGTRYSFVTWAW